MDKNEEMGDGMKNQFGIPLNHRLVLTRYRQTGFRRALRHGIYDEFDPSGKLINHYKEWDIIEPV